MGTNTTIGDVTMSAAAASNVEETGVDPRSDVKAIENGEIDRSGLLDHCLDGADADRVQGWGDYVDAVVAAAERGAADGDTFANRVTIPRSG